MSHGRLHSRLLWLTSYPTSHLAPGGYLEHAEISPVLHADDGSISMDDAFHSQAALAHESSKKFGKQIDIQPFLKENIEKAGFVDVVEKKYKWPIGDWPADARLKDIGRWNAQHWIEGIEPWTLRLLTQYLGVHSSHARTEDGSWLTVSQWSLEEVKAWTAKVRTAIYSRKHHAYQPLYVHYPHHSLLRLT